ncbi:MULTISPECIES: T9SS type A sorting domain-containing protein [Aquimarina]|uniref:T9SS type A sorting domain-containing protein n=1 Tax=Aquimarina TaxID=290174 RepID=UPI000A5635E4|nr:MULTISPECIES: T9SS type A sorting domain-containing protein [Aquimarina]
MIVPTHKEWICCIALLILTLSLQAQEVIIPNPLFKKALLEDHNIDTNNNGKIEISEAEAYTDFIYINNNLIFNINGINAFKNITSLSIKNTSIRRIDLSKNTKLKTLVFYKNFNVTTLDLSKNTKLDYIDCYRNNLRSLTVLSPNLKTLRCGGNKLTKLSLPNSGKLEYLTCYNNSITELKLNNLNKLEVLYCYKNKLKHLDLSKNTKLKSLRCDDNKLENLSIDKNIKLKSLGCSDNKLKSLNVRKNTKLWQLYASTNKLTSLDVSKNTSLEYFICANNKLTHLNTDKNIELKQLDCNTNNIKSLSVRKNTKLEKLYCQDNNLTVLIASNNSKLNYMDARQNSIDCILGHPANGATWKKDPETEFCQKKPIVISRTAKKEELYQKESITYPNPVQNILYIQTGQVEKSPATITLTALNNGKSNTKKRIPNSKGVVSINMSAYKTGLYTIKIITKDRVITRKIAKQ